MAVLDSFHLATMREADLATVARQRKKGSTVEEDKPGEGNEGPLRPFVRFRGEWYDLSGFLPHHPGGTYALQRYFQRDISHAFFSVRRDSSFSLFWAVCIS